MAGKNVIVTGGGSGIGRGIVDALVAAGDQVWVVDLSEAALNRLAGDHGDRVRTTVADISNHPLVVETIAAWTATGEPIWGLVNNAGWDESRRFIDTEADFRRKVIDINLLGPINMTHAVLPHLIAGGGGRVVSIASDAGRVGSSGEAVYSAAKGGTIALMKTLAREHARDGITFNSVCPGPTDTPLLASIDSSGKLQQALERAVPMKRLAQPDDFPALVQFFLSDDSSYVTGQTVSVSGGLSMHG